MNILSPPTIWIDKRCYRTNEIFEKTSKQEYIEDDLYKENDDSDDDYEITEIEGNRFKSSFHIPQIFLGQIIGGKGITRKRIEAETKTILKFPKQGVKEDTIVIGPTRKSIVDARRKIDITILAAREKQQFTHFLSIPFNNQEIKNSFSKFKNSVLTTGTTYEIDESLFQNSDKLHLTIATLTLVDNEDRVFAAQCLQECIEETRKLLSDHCKPIQMTLCGLEYMNDDPRSVDVLYGKVNCEPLQKIADYIVDYFAKKGLSKKKYDSVKLHVTLLNSLFRNENQNDGTQTSNSFNQNRKSFDIRNILLDHKDIHFGKQTLNEIHLSQRYSTGSNKFYEATSILKLC